jgi:hypothetical protein
MQVFALQFCWFLGLWPVANLNGLFGWKFVVWWLAIMVIRDTKK